MTSRKKTRTESKRKKIDRQSWEIDTKRFTYELNKRKRYRDGMSASVFVCRIECFCVFVWRKKIKRKQIEQVITNLNDATKKRPIELRETQEQ